MTNRQTIPDLRSPEAALVAQVQALTAVLRNSAPAGGALTLTLDEFCREADAARARVRHVHARVIDELASVAAAFADLAGLIEDAELDDGPVVLPLREHESVRLATGKGEEEEWPDEVVTIAANAPVAKESAEELAERVEFAKRAAVTQREWPEAPIEDPAPATGEPDGEGDEVEPMTKAGPCWTIHASKGAIMIEDGNGRRVVKGQGGVCDRETAALICRAVNCRDDLVATLRALLADTPYVSMADDCECGDFADNASCVHSRAHAALARAKGGA